MNKAYPIILEPADEGGYIVYVPDFDAYTQGADYGDALYMARDLIGLLTLDMLEDNKTIPTASDFDAIRVNTEIHQVKLLVDLDFEKYRRDYDTRAVRKNCTIPAWLNDEAISKGINFSAVLQNALKKELGIL